MVLEYGRAYSFIIKREWIITNLLILRQILVVQINHVQLIHLVDVHQGKQIVRVRDLRQHHRDVPILFAQLDPVNVVWLVQVEHDQIILQAHEHNKWIIDREGGDLREDLVLFAYYSLDVTFSYELVSKPIGKALASYLIFEGVFEISAAVKSVLVVSKSNEAHRDLL